MNKTTWLIVVAVIIVIIGIFVYVGFSKDQSQTLTPTNATSTVVTFDPLNATYTIDGHPVTFTNGRSNAATAPGSAEQITATIFDVAAPGDLNGDGKPDTAVILTQDTGGSGTFYYAAAAINTPTGAQGTNAILLGDRIAPQNISIQNDQVVVNYADRKPGEPFSTQPSVGVTKYLSYNSSTLEESVPAGH